MMRSTIIILLCIVFPAHFSFAGAIYQGKSEGMAYEVIELANQLRSPWGMTFVAEDELLITEKIGGVVHLNISTGVKKKMSGVPPILVTGQGGLLDVAAPPEYGAGDYLYFTYSKARNGQGVTVLARARLKSTRLMDWQELLVTESGSDSGRHFGSRITFDDDHVFFSIGDRGERPNGQDLSTHAGTIVRLTRDGRVPEDNPFVEGQGLQEIWSYGHRNPQGLFFDRQKNMLWSNEHGPRGGDEINIIIKGGNYGWPVVSHGKEYWGPKRVGETTSKAGMEDGIKIFTPSIAPGSLLVYSGRVFDKWQHNLFSGALKLEHLNRVVVDEHYRPVKEERLLESLEERIRAVIEGPKGLIYLATDSGRILRLQPQPPD